MCDCQNNKNLTGLGLDLTPQCQSYQKMMEPKNIAINAVAGTVIWAGIAYFASKQQNKKHNAVKYGSIGAGILALSYTAYYLTQKGSCT